MQTHLGKRYLVTGGAGFIGSHLVDALIAAGHAVVVLDDFSTGKWENAHPMAETVAVDVTEYTALHRLFAGVDGCFHLAAIASVARSVSEWRRTHAVNLGATINVFEAARTHGGIPVVYASSAAVYGDSPVTPLAENARPQPLTAYGADKLGCELHARVAWHVHGVPALGFRPFNVYGPRQDPGSPYSGVVSIFMDRLQRGLPITIFGDGEQVRDFVHVSDAVRALLVGMGDLKDGHSVVNLCTGRGTSVQRLARIAADVVGVVPRMDHAPARAGDIRVSIGDPSRLEDWLGVLPRISLEHGLATLLEHRTDHGIERLG